MSDEQFTTYRVKRDGEPDLKFKGEIVAEASTSPDKAGGNYSGSTGRWTELTIYRTAKGKYVCQSIGRTQWQGEHDRYSAVVCGSDIDTMVRFFGHDRLARRLYTEAGFDVAEEVE